MKNAVIYHSTHHGNTRKVAETLASELEADLFDISKSVPQDLGRYDLVGFGSGIYFSKHSRLLLHTVKELRNLKGAHAFIFSTRGGGPPLLYHRSLRLTLRDRGVIIVGEFSCKALDTVGPLKFFGGINKKRPAEKDFEKARLFAQTVVGTSAQRASH